MPGGVSRTRSLDLDRFAAPAAAVDSFMQSWLAGRALPANLAAAIAYVFEGGGKRLRPLLALSACEALGGAPERALPAACAIELVHAFSLVHDDLPALDDDALRRGRPTLHVHAGEAMAILAGDAMLGLAFELVASPPAEPELAGRLAFELARATNDMIAGQVYDTLPVFDAALGARERLELVHTHKTGALIRCACRMGGLAGGAGQAELARLGEYAAAVGLMFQVVDDLLDVTQTTAQLGKTAGKDAEQGKLTYPAVLGVAGSQAEVERLRAAARSALGPFGAAADPLRELCDWIAVRTH